MDLEVFQTSGSELEEVLCELLPHEPELAYSNFAPIAARPGAAVTLHRTRWLTTDELIGCWVARRRGGPVLAAVRVERRPFESDYFGVRAARIEAPVAVANGERRLAALRVLYSTALEVLRQQGWEHVAARASTRDRCAPWALQEQRFFHVDTQVSWMCPLSGTPHDEVLPLGLHFEVHDRRTVARIDRRQWQRLAEWSGKAFDRGPFVFDWSVPYDRACGIYEVWTEKMMAGEWADAVILVRRDEEVVAFISMLEMPDVSAAAGARVYGRGLGATLPGYRGLFTAIQREMIAQRPLGADFMENETQVATIGSVNVYAKLGFRYLRSTSTFHQRLVGVTQRLPPR